LQILVFGCCSGAEPISLASVLKKQFPDLDFHIRAYDIVPEVIERAQSPLYSEEEVFQGPFVTDEVVAQTFETTEEGYRVRPDLMSHIT
ncbi:CheR family methyltransferase, partial [Thiomicrospira sp. XS5]|uniref:CheR family methyltransferase n=1 Tax=Thiomicrospira sp. XS5 TaxID=1775636 RepID=UPI000A9E317D